MIAKWIFVGCGVIWIVYSIAARKSAEMKQNDLLKVDATVASGVGVLWFIVAYLCEIKNYLID